MGKLLELGIISALSGLLFIIIAICLYAYPSLLQKTWFIGSPLAFIFGFAQILSGYAIYKETKQKTLTENKIGQSL